MNLTKKLKSISLSAIDRIRWRDDRAVERVLILQARLLSERNLISTRIPGIHAAEFSVFSQWGEDGIVDWLVRIIPNLPQVFIEFGVDDYSEANTRFLLTARNWRGLVLDGSPDNVSRIRNRPYFWRHDLTAVSAFIDAQNINDLIGDAGISGPIGLLSIDIDGNDYWIWKAITVVQPIIVVCEYNAILGDRHSLTVPYTPKFERKHAHFSHLYYGSSIRGLISLAQEKHYVFLGTTSTGCNAFFVRSDYAPLVLSRVEDVWLFPSLFRESRSEDGRLSFVRGPERVSLIADQPVLELKEQRLVRLAELEGLYSEEWERGSGYGESTHDSAKRNRATERKS